MDVAEVRAGSVGTANPPHSEAQRARAGRAWKVLRTAGVYLALIVLALFFIGPFILMISVSLQPDLQFLTFPLDIVPPHPSLEAYASLFADTPITRWIFNSTVVSIAVLFG